MLLCVWWRLESPGQSASIWIVGLEILVASTSVHSLPSRTSYIRSCLYRNTPGPGNTYLQTHQELDKRYHHSVISPSNLPVGSGQLGVMHPSLGFFRPGHCQALHIPSNGCPMSPSYVLLARVGGYISKEKGSPFSSRGQGLHVLFDPVSRYLFDWS